MSNEEKLFRCTDLAQSYIMLFLEEYMNYEQLQGVRDLFINCPVVIGHNAREVNEFGKITNIGGTSESDKISISLSDIEKVNITDEVSANGLLGVIIHEYAHKIRAINNEYGEMFEEAFASIFAEVCINNARAKLGNDGDKQELFEMLDSVNYQGFESQVRGILYILKQHGIDKRLIAEYIAGSQEYFKQICIQIFGDAFIDYFNTVSSRNNSTSETMLISIITQYIKQRGLNISAYWSKDGNQLSEDNLYFRGSPTLCRGVVAAGKESFKLEEQEFYKHYEYSANVADENSARISQEKIDRINQVIETKFSLNRKSIEELYDTIIDLCSTYIQHQNRDDEESKIFIGEITKLIPRIDELRTKFVSLRVAGLDRNIFENLDLDNITFDDIIRSMNSLLNIQTEENGNIGK